jgi:hypothetical protein
MFEVGDDKLSRCEDAVSTYRQAPRKAGNPLFQRRNKSLRLRSQFRRGEIVGKPYQNCRGLYSMEG